MFHLAADEGSTYRRTEKGRGSHLRQHFHRITERSLARPIGGTIEGPSNLETRRQGELTGRAKGSKLEGLPQTMPERVELGARPNLENSTVCHMSMPNLWHRESFGSIDARFLW